MRTFPTAYAAEKDKTSGIYPVWILSMTINSVNYLFSDHVFTCPLGTTKGIVKSWGRVQEGVGGYIDEYSVGDFTVSLISDPSDANNIRNLSKANILETNKVTLYKWFTGLSDDPQIMFSGYVRDINAPSDLVVDLTIQDETVRLESLYVGTKATKATYPNIDPDDVNKVEPIVFGSVDRLRALSVVSGAQTSIPNNLNSTDTSFDVSDGSALSVGMSIGLDDEEMYISNIATNTLTVTRGYNSTIATNHLAATLVVEQRNDFTYLFANHPVDSIDAIYGRVGAAEMDISALCTAYTGKVGDELTGYSGKGVLRIPGVISVQKAVDLLVNDGLTLSDAMTIVDSIAVNDSISVSDTIAISDGIAVSTGSHTHSEALQTVAVVHDSAVDIVGAVDFIDSIVDGNLNTGGLVGGSDTARTYAVMPVNLPGTPTRMRLCMSAGGSGTSNLRAKAYINGSYKGYVQTASSTKVTVKSAWYTITNWSTVTATNTYAELDNTDTVNQYLWQIWWEVEYDPSSSYAPASGVAKTGTVSKSGGATKSGSASKSGTVTRSGTLTLSGSVTMSGNSVTDTLVADQILVSCTRNITACDAVIDHIGQTFGGLDPLILSGSFPASYSFDGAITEYKSVLAWLNSLALQCRSYFKMSLGAPKLLVRPDTLTSVKTITDCRVVDNARTLSLKRSPIDDVVNVVEIAYDRDWSVTKAVDSETDYKASTRSSDPTSIAAYGERERPDMFRFDFVVNDTMADSLRDFYLGLLKDRKWDHSFLTYLDHSELEFGDIVTLGFEGNYIGEILEAGVVPGSAQEIDQISFMVR